jgi:PAS domain S-box-containing protein
VSAAQPRSQARARPRQHRLLTVLGIALVAVFVLGEVLLVRSYERTSSTTRDFQHSNDTSTGLANAEADALLMTQAVARLRDGGPAAALRLRRAQLEHHIDVVEQAGDEAPAVKAHLRAIRADVARFDGLLATRAGRDGGDATAATRAGRDGGDATAATRAGRDGGDATAATRPGRDGVDAALARLASDIRGAFDDEQHDLSAALARRHNEGPEEQRLVAFLGAFALLMAAGLAIVIRRAIRGDFAQARDMLESSEARFQQLVEQFPAVVYALSLPEDGRPPAPVYVSPQMLAITGVSAEETTRRGLKWLSGHVPQDDQWGLGVALAAAAGGAPLPPIDFRFIKPGGEEIWLRASNTAVTDGPEGRRLQGLVFDITETMHAQTEHTMLETELRLAQKLEAVGQLAAGIAHEINTPVQFVGDTVSFLRDAFGDLMGLQPAQAAVNRAAAAGPVPAELLERVRAAEDHADLDYLRERVPAAFARATDGLGRVAAIVGAMREFAHPPTSEQLAFDLNDALRNTLIVAANAYKYTADVTTDFGALPAVLCNGGDMNQVFINLIVNAAHAIEDRVGESGERGAIVIHTRHDGDHVLVSVTDTGGGIPAEVAERIFDPFFTTKDVGRGTGQGLAIARTIVVERHGGTLTFDSEPGRGTTFHVRLPVAGLTPATEPQRIAA